MTEKLINGELLKKMFEFGAKNLELNKSVVDELNVFPVPDGDTGTNMSMTISNSVKELEKCAQPNLYSIAKTASSGALIGARGNSGVILSQLLRGMADGCSNRETLDIEGVAVLFRMAADAAYKAVMKPTEGTILTVAREMAEFAMAHYTEYDALDRFCRAVNDQGQEALKRTPEMLPVLKEAGVVDSGGQGLMYIIEGAYLALTGQELGKDVKLDLSTRERFVDDSGMRPEDITFGYCTEFIVKNAAQADENALCKFLNGIGDCVLVIKDDDIIKVHVHTDHPGQAFEKGLEYGTLTRMKVDNMREMFGVDETKPAEQNQEKTVEAQKQPYGFVAVSPGEGLTKLFHEMGITKVISGGQTMNPSTQDFLNEADQINADDIFLFPNNGNIIMAANQAKAISEKRLHVIPSKSITQCVSAMFAFNADGTPETNEENMIEAVGRVHYGEVTYAIRDTKMSGLKIKKGDIIGLYDGEIAVKGKSIDKVTEELLGKMCDEDSELISLYYGQDVTEEEARELADSIGEVFDDCDVEINNSGQPLYYYFVSVE